MLTMRRTLMAARGYAPPGVSLQFVSSKSSGSTEFDPIKLFLQPMKSVVADFATGAHRKEGAPSGPDGTSV
jgi:hypothetical protein